MTCWCLQIDVFFFSISDKPSVQTAAEIRKALGPLENIKGQFPWLFTGAAYTEHDLGESEWPVVLPLPPWFTATFDLTYRSWSYD